MPQEHTSTAQANQAVQLVVLEPATYRGRRIELVKDELVVGRETRCDVRFDDPYLSRAHAVLRRCGDTVYVHDLNSRAGTLVNGAAVSASRPLRPGDVVAFAHVKLRLEPTDHTRTRVHLFLVWIGFLVFAAGAALFAVGILGPGLLGIPAGLLGWTLAAAGALLAMVGIVVHLVTTTRVAGAGAHVSPVRRRPPA
jgi:FHA domain